MKNKLTAVAFVALALAAASARAATYDLATEFGPTNPSLPWDYGYTGPGATSGAPFPNYVNSGSLEYWNDPSLPQTSIFNTPSVAHNISGKELTSGTVVFLPGQATFHPGQNGQYAGYLFLTPHDGQYKLNASFSGRDFVGPTDTLVNIIVGNRLNTPLFSGVVDGYAGDSTRAAFGPSPTIGYNGTLSLTTNEFVYFLVEFDPNGGRGSGPFYYDTTGISATFTTVPEPTALALFGMGFAAIGLRLRRR